MNSPSPQQLKSMCRRNFVWPHVMLYVVEGVLSYHRQILRLDDVEPNPVSVLLSKTRRTDRRHLTHSVASHSVFGAQSHRLSQLSKRKHGIETLLYIVHLQFEKLLLRNRRSRQVSSRVLVSEYTPLHPFSRGHVSAWRKTTRDGAPLAWNAYRR